MFCPPNDKLQNLTEKTKLLAQKCTQQIRNGQQQMLQIPFTKEEKQNFKCFCPCKGPLNLKVLAKKQSLTNKETTTKWYVKVIQ